MTQILGSLLGSSSSVSSSSSSFPAHGQTSAPEGSGTTTTTKTAENTVHAKAKVQSFFSSPLVDDQTDSADRAAPALRLTCLRCQGSVEGPKHSTCKCSVPALKKEDLGAQDEPSTTSAGAGMFSGMSGIMRRMSNLASTANTKQEPVLQIEESDSVAL